MEGEDGRCTDAWMWVVVGAWSCTRTRIWTPTAYQKNSWCGTHAHGPWTPVYEPPGGEGPSAEGRETDADQISSIMFGDTSLSGLRLKEVASADSPRQEQDVLVGCAVPGGSILADLLQDLNLDGG